MDWGRSPPRFGVDWGISKSRKFKAVAEECSKEPQLAMKWERKVRGELATDSEHTHALIAEAEFGGRKRKRACLFNREMLVKEKP